MPVIRVSDDVFRRLKAHAEPLVDSASDVIVRLLDEIEGSTEPKSVSNPDQFAYDSAFLRLKSLISEEGGHLARYRSAKYWHRWDLLPAKIYIACETKRRTPRHMNIYINTGRVDGIKPPAGAEQRSSGAGHTSRPGKPIEDEPHLLLQIKTQEQLESSLRFLRGLLKHGRAEKDNDEG